MGVPDSDDKAGNADPEPTYVLTRAALQDGSLLSHVIKSYPEMQVLTEEERAASLADTLRERPDHGDGVWLFAYGSLIWNPIVHFAERRVARIEGWHRAFCLSTPLGRGSPENPGLVLALDQGGTCVGVALRIPEELVAVELELVWRREMLSGAYTPRWLPVASPDGGSFGSAIAFTINSDNPFYVKQLSEAQTVSRLATARGRLGSAAEYLFSTRDGLRSLDVHDELVERLSDAVEKAQIKPEA